MLGAKNQGLGELARANKHKRRCAYCDSTTDLTDDHIPPRCLFSKPRPSNLLTVPCCENCRTGWSNDDEHFAIAVSWSAWFHEAPKALEPGNRFLRGLRMPQKLAFLKHLQSQSREVSLGTPGGIFLGTTGAVLFLDRSRIDRVGGRIVRGLFFKEFGRIFPQSHKIDFRLDQFSNNHIVPEISQCPLPSRTYADDQFRYKFAATQEDPDCTAWFGDFYGTVKFVGITTRLKAEG